MTIPPDILEQFERAFSSHGGGCRRKCHCGREFYNPDPLWSWDEGEIEGLEARKATPLDYTVSTLILDGFEYVMDCQCWHDRAAKVINWIADHAGALAEFLTMEKARKQRAADASPVVRELSKT